MWYRLWEDFVIRAERLAGGAPPRDVVDLAILMQLEGREPFVKQQVPLEALHLPELYCGSPWRENLDVPERLRQNWVALAALNPSIDLEEVFVQLQHWRNQAQRPALPAFFDGRHDPGLREAPRRHGRNRRGEIGFSKVNNRFGKSRTWTRLDALMREALALAGIQLQAPVGWAGAVVDVVPWKFRSWGELGRHGEALLKLIDPAHRVVDRSITEQFVDAGRGYFLRTITTHRPAVVVALGADSRWGLQELMEHREQIEHGAYPVWRWYLEDGYSPVVIESPHPMAHGTLFGDAMPGVARKIAQYAQW